MKTKFLALSLIFSSQLLFAQWTDVINNNINFSFEVQDNHYTGSNDSDNSSDPVIQNDFNVITNGTSNWTGWECYSWECTAPCYNYNNPIVHSFYDKPFDTQIQITGYMYEADNAPLCEYESSIDDHFWNGYCTFRNGAIQQRVTYQSTDFYPGAWNPNLGQSGSGWIFPDAPNFNQIWRQIWRYRYGNNIGALLNFGTIGIGDSKRDVNSNRTITPNDGLMVYTHTSESVNPSPDVWYEFTLSEPGIVSITTASSRTNFDTYIRLLDSNNNFIDQDYDDGGNLTSLITRKLCAGNYKFLVEGWQNNTGVFEVTVSVAAPDILTSTKEITGESCPGEANGIVNVFGFNGGVIPYTFNWNNETSTNLTFTNLEAGMYPLFITDACGTNSTETVIVPGDETPPTALCNPNVVLNVWSGNDAVLAATMVDDGSNDNCDISSYSVSPSSFSVSDVGNNTVTLTVTDGSGNTDQCTTTVTVNNTTGVEEAELLSNMLIYPNPSEGIFKVDLSSADLDEDATLSVVDKLGRVVFTTAAIQSNMNIDLAGITGGVYLVRVENEGITASKRIVVLK